MMMTMMTTLTMRVLEVRRPVVQLYAGVLAAPCEPQHVVASVVDLVLEFTDRLTCQTHVVDDVQRPVDLPHIATAVQSPPQSTSSFSRGPHSSLPRV